MYKLKLKILFTTVGPAADQADGKCSALKGMKLNLRGTCATEAGPLLKTNTIPSNVSGGTRARIHCRQWAEWERSPFVLRASE